MIRLHLLGGIALTDGGGATCDQVLSQPKRLAMLAYLATADHGKFRRRDIILPLFWPEATEKKARLALNQTLHFLRQSLGAGVIVSRGQDEIGIASEMLWCDVSAFDQMRRSGDPAGALDLYKGELLPGFFIAAAPEFDQWLSDERARLRRASYAAAWELAQDAERSGDLSAAGAWGRRAAALSANDEPCVRDLVRLLDRIGDPAGALEAYEAFALRLKRECDARPSAETRELALAVRASLERDSQLVRRPSAHPDHLQRDATVATTRSPDDESEGQNSATTSSGADERVVTRPTDARRTPRWRWLVGSVVVVCLAASTTVVHRGATAAHRGAVNGNRASIVVRRFDSALPQPSSLHDAAALTTALVDQLAQVRSFDVSSLDDRGTQPSDRAATTSRIEIAGTLSETPEEFRVSVEMIDAASGRVFKTAAFEYPHTKPSTFVDSVSLAISSSVRTAVGRELRLRTWTLDAGNDRAYTLMQEADAARERAGQLAASGNLQAAIRAFASADSTLLEVEHALPRASEPMTERAQVLQTLGAMTMLPPIGDRRRGKALLDRAMSEARRAVTRAPGDAAARETLGSIAYWYWLTVPTSVDSTRTLGDQAARNLRAAVELDPSRATAWGLLSALLYARADYVGAYLTAERAYRADAYLRSPETILDLLFVTSQEIGDTAASRRWCSEIHRRLERDGLGAYCDLRLLISQPPAPDNHAIARAWQVAAGVRDSSGHNPKPTADLQMLVAVVIARQGLRDSAEAVIQDARKRDESDPELLPAEAEARIALGQPERATALLTQYAAHKPQHRVGVVRSRRFSSLPQLGHALDSMGIAAVDQAASAGD